MRTANHNEPMVPNFNKEFEGQFNDQESRIECLNELLGFPDDEDLVADIDTVVFGPFGLDRDEAEERLRHRVVQMMRSQQAES